MHGDCPGKVFEEGAHGKPVGFDRSEDVEERGNEMLEWSVDGRNGTDVVAIIDTAW